MELDNGILAILALSPILIAGILLVGFRFPAKIVMPIVFIITSFIAYFFWGVTPSLKSLYYITLT